jgi:CLIP-associating protein 1/2
VVIFTEKELLRQLDRVAVGLANADDWQARISALLQLQGLALGDGAAQYSAALVSGIRNGSIAGLLGTQIADLRSVVSKEANRTAAVLARRLGSAFVPLAELLFAGIFRLLSLKVRFDPSTSVGVLSARLISIPFPFPFPVYTMLFVC